MLLVSVNLINFYAPFGMLPLVLIKPKFDLARKGLGFGLDLTLRLRVNPTPYLNTENPLT